MDWLNELKRRLAPDTQAMMTKVNPGPNMAQQMDPGAPIANNPNQMGAMFPPSPEGALNAPPPMGNAQSAMTPPINPTGMPPQGMAGMAPMMMGMGQQQPPDNSQAMGMNQQAMDQMKQMAMQMRQRMQR